MSAFNTTYEQKYVVVSREGTTALLRVVDKSLYASYWKEFISADVRVCESPMYIRLEQVPPDVVLVDQYAAYVPDTPIVILEADGKKVNISSRVSSNAPNTEVPGLYRVDFHVNMSSILRTPIWGHTVSVQQRFVLRSAAAKYVRDGYIVRTLNRLVMEPQFLEALHAAGEPLYGFMEANQHPSIKASRLPEYGGIEAWGAGGAFNSNSNGIFISGMKLPQGSIVIYRQRMLQLREPVWPDMIGARPKMDTDTHEERPAIYSIGSVVRAGDRSYIAVADATADTPVGDSDYWMPGYLYKYNVLNGDQAEPLPRGRLPKGKDGILHIWVTVDDEGYSFWVDIVNTLSLGHYRGYYDRKAFADYCTGDIVSYIQEGSVRLYRRKATDMQDPATLIYPPGHYLNPAWEEVYCHIGDNWSPLFGEYSIVPHTNASNAIIAKTWSVSMEMCLAFAHMVGIPDTIVKECGAKWSALLFALLSRTRNTYEGLRLCLRAVGLDISNLRLSDPSIAYECSRNGEAPEIVPDVYAQHEILRGLLANIDTLAPEGKETETEGALRYVSGDAPDAGVAIQQYSEASGWTTKYRFLHIDPAQCHNNRYYEADLNVLSRLAEDAVVDLGDGKDWVKESAWAGSPSALLPVCLKYEIPIYIHLLLKMHLYAENTIRMKGIVYSGISDGQRGNAKCRIDLYPSKYYSRAAHDYVMVDTGVFTLEDGEWVALAPASVDGEKGIKTYIFDHAMYPLRIKAMEDAGCEFVRYWQSTHTYGLLGLPDSTSTINEVPAHDPAHFRNVTFAGVDDRSLLMLANGHVGITALYRPMEATATATAMHWLHILSDGDSWTLDEETPFAAFGPIGITPIYAYEGTVADLKARTATLASSAQEGAIEYPFEWDGDTLVLRDAMPESIYMLDGEGKALCAYRLIPDPYAFTEKDWEEYGDNLESVRISFEYA